MSEKPFPRYTCLDLQADISQDYKPSKYDQQAAFSWPLDSVYSTFFTILKIQPSVGQERIQVKACCMLLLQLLTYFFPRSQKTRFPSLLSSEAVAAHYKGGGLLTTKTWKDLL